MGNVQPKPKHGSNSLYGQGCRCARCTVAHADYHRDYIRQPKVKARIAAQRKIKRQRIDQIKIQRGCMDCGYHAHPVALDFDHHNSDKTYNISQMLGYPWPKIEAEMAKCELVCANCHRIRTMTRRGWD